MPNIILSLRVSDTQKKAYTDAARESGANRNAWAITAIRVAIGVEKRPFWHRPARYSNASSDKHMQQMALRLREIEQRMALDAAMESHMTLGRWCVIVLDIAAGISDLSTQLFRLRL